MIVDVKTINLGPYGILVMCENINNEHFKKRRAEIEMYNAGVDSGIRFAMTELLQNIHACSREDIVKELIKKYHE